MSERFSVGDEVEWISQAGGHWTTKQGEVVAVIPAGDPINKHLCRVMHDFNIWRKHLAYGGGFRRSEESYLVLIGRNDPNVKTMLYWPRTKHLKRKK